MKKEKDENIRFTITFACICLILIPTMSDYISILFTPILFFVCKHSSGFRLRDTQKSAATFALSAFLILQFINIIHSAHKVASLGFSLLWAVAFLGYIVISEIASNKSRIQKILYSGTVAGGIVGGIGAVQMFLYHFGGIVSESLRTAFNPFWNFFHKYVVKIFINVFPQSFASHFGVDFDTVKVSRFVTRACSTFSNPIFYAAFLVMILPIAIHCVFQLKDKISKRVISGISVVLIVCGIALSYSRGAYLAALLAITITLFCEKRQTIISVLLLPVFLILIPSGAYERLLTLTTNRNDISLTTHSRIYQAAFETIKEHWLFGLGTGNDSFEDILHNKYGIMQPHAHNIFLELFIEGGVFGLILFVLTLVFLAIGLIKVAVKAKDGRAIGVTLLASFAGFMCCGMFDYIFYGPKPIQIFMILAGLIEATRRVWLKKGKTLMCDVPDEVVAE